MLCRIFTKPLPLKKEDNEWSPYYPNARAQADIKSAMYGERNRKKIKELNMEWDRAHTHGPMLVCSACHGEKMRVTEQTIDKETDTVIDETVLTPSRDLHHEDDKKVQLIEQLQDPLPPISRNRAGVKKSFKEWARKTYEKPNTTRLTMANAEMATRLMKKELLVGATAATMEFWLKAISPFVALAMLMKSPMFRQAVDWVCGVGPGVQHKYACENCWIIPLTAAAWYCMSGWYDEATDTLGTGHEWRCSLCCFAYNSTARAFRTIIMTKEIWGENLYFFFGGDKPNGLKDKEITAESHPRETAELLFSLAKACVLATYIYDEHGRRAKVTATMLRATLGNLMKDFANNLRAQIEPEFIVEWEANRGITEYSKWQEVVVDQDQTLCISVPGTKQEGVDLKRVREKELRKKYGHKVTDKSFKNDLYYDPKQWWGSQGSAGYNKLGNAVVTQEMMTGVIDKLSDEEALQLARWCFFFYKVDEMLYDRMCNEWTKKGKGSENDIPLHQLVLAKQQSDQVRREVVANIPISLWENSAHLSHSSSA